MRCVYCNEPVDPLSPRTWHLIVGWERKATGATRKSGSDIALRQPRDKYACDACVQRKKRGIAPTQETLI